MMFFPLQSWIFMYFPTFRPDQNPLGQRETPWAERWGDGGAVDKRRNYRAELDAMSADSVSVLFRYFIWLIFYFCYRDIILKFWIRWIGCPMVSWIWPMLSVHPGFMVWFHFWVLMSPTCRIGVVGSTHAYRRYLGPLSCQRRPIDQRRWRSTSWSTIQLDGFGMQGIPTPLG